MSQETSAAQSPVNVARLFTARYLVPKPILMGVVPVRISMRPPLVPLSYKLEETAWSLVPKPWMVGEWPWLSPTYWCHLDGQGAQKIGKELKAISERYGGSPLALLDYEDLTKGHRSLRVVFAAWWETNAGEVVHELLDDGQILHYSQLHRRTRPKRPKDPREDRRWTDDEVLGWPISHEEFERWARRRHWQFARTMPQNPHEYTHRAWGHEETFLRVVLHLREHGRQEVYGGDLYTYYVANGFKHWTMGADLMSTILINRKPVGQDEGNEETEERPGRVPQPDLFRLGPRGEGVTVRTETAYHEAGHAVALYALGFDLGDVSIVASEEHLGLIGIPIDEALADRLDMLKFSDDGETFIVRRIAGVFAGVRAVEILTGREHDPRSSDTQTWLPHSDWSQLNLWLPLAAEDPDEQPHFYDQAWDEAEHVLRENWDAVQALAEALLERQELSAAAVRSILQEAGCARDEAPIRRVVLEVQGDKLRERLHKLMSEGDPENEMEGLQERLASTKNEWELLRQEEKES